MTEEEKLSVIKCVVDETAGQIPVIAGTGANCTQNVIDFSQKVEKLGVDGLLVVTPYYNKATQNGLYAHYAAIAGRLGFQSLCTTYRRAQDAIYFRRLRQGLAGILKI